MKRYILIILIATTAILSSCTSTSLVTSWKAHNAPKISTYKKIMVIGLMGDKDMGIRQKSEAAIVQSFANIGISALSSYEEFGPKEFRSMNEQEVVDKLNVDSVDAVLFVVLLDKAKERDWYPGAVYYTPFGGYYYGSYWWQYNIMYGRVYAPDYYSTTTTYFLEADLYSVANNKLEYSAHTKSVDPSSATTLSEEFSNLILKDLQAKKLLDIPAKK